MSKRQPDTVHIVPIPGVAIPPETFSPPLRAVEQDVSPEQWERIDEFRPRAFRRIKPTPAQSQED